MTKDERLTEFICSLEPDQDPILEQIEEEARAERVPIIRKETGAFLKTWVAAVRPKAILEVGTAVGYSALTLASAAGPDCQITTIESYEKRIIAARENFKRAGRKEQVRLLEGDAGAILPTLPKEAFDLIFMDAAKGQYLTWLPAVLERLRPGGVLISDNVLQEGDILQSRFAVERRDRTIHSRMRGYLSRLKRMEELETAIVPIGDGVTVSVKKCKGSWIDRDRHLWT